MKTNEEYDKHLQDFYSQTFREYVAKNGIGNKNYGPNSSEAQKYADDMLSAYGAAINQGMAYELLNKIEMNCKTPEEQLDNYPAMFWQTKNGVDMLNNMVTDTVKKENCKLFDIEDLSSEQMLDSWKKVVNLARKIALKNPDLGYTMVAEFNYDFVSMLKAKVEHKNFNTSEAEKGYQKVLEEVTVQEDSFNIPAYVLLDSHMMAVKATEKTNPINFGVKEPKLKI